MMEPKHHLGDDDVESGSVSNVNIFGGLRVVEWCCLFSIGTSNLFLLMILYIII